MNWSEQVRSLIFDLRHEADELAPCRGSLQLNPVEYADLWKEDGVEAMTKRAIAMRLQTTVLGIRPTGVCSLCGSDECHGISYGWGQ